MAEAIYVEQYFSLTLKYLKIPDPIHLVPESAVLCTKWAANIVSWSHTSIFFISKHDSVLKLCMLSLLFAAHHHIVTPPTTQRPV